MEESFPRGRRKYKAIDSSEDISAHHDKEKSNRRKNHELKKKRDADDFLFGSAPAQTKKSTSDNKSSKRRKESFDDGEEQRSSLLPLGGGAVVTIQGKGEGGDQYIIESLGFTKLHPGFQILAIVREVHEDLAILSLPNHWTGFMLRTGSNSPTCEAMLREGQILSVTIVSAVQEASKNGPRRRIQVSCLPEKVNIGLSLDEKIKRGEVIRGQVKTIEDHGFLVDLGFQQRGFLSFDDIEGEYELIEEEDEDSEKLDKVQHILGAGRVLDFVVKESSSDDQITPLSLPSHESRAKLFMSAHKRLPSLHSLQPGALVKATVEAFARNGLLVSFAHGAFRGAIDTNHLGSFFIPENRLKESDEWKTIFQKNRSFSARIIAIDATTKIVRLSLAEHIMNLHLPRGHPEVGSLFRNAVVLRCDPGLGALFALTTPNDETEEDQVPKPFHPPACNDQRYLDGQKIKVAYVHISKAVDNYEKNKEETDATFNKDFAQTTKHDVRILATTNLVEGYSAGAAAPSIVGARVFSYSDLVPCQVHKQVPVVKNLDNGGVIVDFGNDVRGLISPMHLFDHVSASEYRSKMQKIKYAVGAKVDIRVLRVDVENKKCLVTAKKSLVNTKHVFSSFEELKVGQLGTGFVSKVTDRGLNVCFFDEVNGIVPHKNLRTQALEGNYAAGDIIQCRVRQIRKKPFMWHLTLAVATEETAQDENMQEESAKKDDRLMRIPTGQIIARKALRVVELKGTQKQTDRLIPGYAIVEVKTKLLTESFDRDMPGLIECKLPFDQLVDEYDPEDVESPSALDFFASKILSLGELIDKKSIVLIDPKKSVAEHRDGIGKLPVLSLREKFIETAESKPDPDKEIILPGSDDHIFNGATVRGFVAHIDPRHGAFITFLDNMRALLPKSDDVTLSLYSTVAARVSNVDITVTPPKILLSSKRVHGKLGYLKFKDMARPEVGDVIKKAVVVKISFHRATLRILDKKFASNEAIKAAIHSTLAPAEVPGQEDTMEESSGFHTDHPFYKWRPGLEIANLTVITSRFEESNGIVQVDLSSRENKKKISESSSAQIGQTLTGIVSFVPENKSGIWVMLSPSDMGFVPILEASNKHKVLKALDSKFPGGMRISGRVTGRRKMSSRNKEEETKEIIRLSLLPERKGELTKGTILFGRVNRRKALPGGKPPHLPLDLPGGKTGRCCITELADPDKWSNFPLGKANLGKGKTKKQDDNDKDEEEEDDSDDESQGSDTEPGDDDSQSISGQYPHGKILQCCVLECGERNIEVSCRESRLKGCLDDDPVPAVGEKTAGYVIDTTKSGSFLRISRNVEARVILRNLSVVYTKDPPAAFPRGRLVVGRVKAVQGAQKADKGGREVTLLDMSLRETDVADNEKKLSFDDIQIGSKYKGTVTSIKEYGVFVLLQNSDVSGLVHKSECSENFVADVSSVYDPGDMVKVLVLLKDEDKKRIGLSMKASHFINDDDDEEEEDDEEEAVSVDGSEEEEGEVKQSSSGSAREKMDIDEEEESDKEAEEEQDSDDKEAEEEQDSDDKSDIDSEADASSDKGPKLDTNIGFDWGGGNAGRASSDKKRRDEESSSESDSEESDDDDDDDNSRSGEKTSRASKKTHAERRKAEIATARREAALADGTADENPETSADFERLLASEPNSSELWIRYMAFHLTLADIVAARQVSEKAFSRIGFRQERDKMNVWCARLTLEVKYGNDESLETALTRGCQQVNPKHIHLRLCEILEKEGSPSAMNKIDELFGRMCKRFKSKKTVWISYVKFLLSKQRSDEAFALSKRALLSLPPYKHIWFMSHFGQLLFENGKSEQARTVFDGLLKKNGKRADLLTLYIDQELKHGQVEAVRQICGRVADTSHPDRLMKLTDKQMKKFFKKWFTVEEKYGSEGDMEAVKNAAKRFVESAKK